MGNFRDLSSSPVGIAGAGRVAQALGRLLYSQAEPVTCIASRTMEHARAAAAFVGPQVEAVSYSELARHASRILICVPDSALESVAATLDASLSELDGIVLHTCGARGPEALQALAGRGVHCGAIHPLQTISDPESGASALHGVAFAIAGDVAALAWAEGIVRAANGRILRISDERRPLYHAAAVMASNYLTALLSAAQSLLIAADVDPEEALQALGPIAKSSLANALCQGPTAALTGPIERDDLSTVATHLAALKDVSGPIPLLYRAAGLQTLELARKKGLCAERAAAAERLLEAPAT